MAPWIGKEMPEMDVVLEARKKLKTLKSKLRHKLADLQDLQEASVIFSLTVE